MIRLLLAGVLVVAGGCDSPPATAPRVLMFSAKWCAPCVSAKAVLRRDSLSAVVRIIDVDKRPDIAEAYGVRRLPEFVAIDSGNKIILRTHDVNVVVDRYGRNSRHFRHR